MCTAAMASKQAVAVGSVGSIGAILRASAGLDPRKRWPLTPRPGSLRRLPKVGCFGECRWSEQHLWKVLRPPRNLRPHKSGMLGRLGWIMNDIQALRERHKELRCLYAVESILSDRGDPTEAFSRILREIPAGWQRPETTGASIVYFGRRYVGPGFSPDGRILSEPVRLWGREVGQLSVSDHGGDGGHEQAAFLPEEIELLRRIAARLGEYLEWKHAELFGERAPATRSHWWWRQRFAEALADRVDPKRFGVRSMLLGGSTARGDAGPASDIDLYIVFGGSEEQRRELGAWLEGWSHCLAEVALQQTGEPFPHGILSVRWLEQEPDPRQRHQLHRLVLRKDFAEPDDR